MGTFAREIEEVTGVVTMLREAEAPARRRARSER